MDGTAGGGRGRGLALQVALGLMIVIALSTAGYLIVSNGRSHLPTASTSTPGAAAGHTQSPSVTPSRSPSPHPASPSPTRAPTHAPAPAPAPARSGPPHIMVIVEENNSYGAIIGNAQLPYINSLAATYGLATNWWGVNHPSEPNYLAMVSGSIWDNPQDLTPQQETYAGPTIVDELAARGIGWKAYMEDMRGPCDLSDTYSPGNYDVNHNPFMYFTSIRNNPGQCNRDVPFTQFATDLSSGQAPPFIFVAPNTLDDMHSGSYATADSWLKTQLALVFRSSWYARGGIVVLTWDEGETGDQIATIVIAANDHGARLKAFGNHYGLCRAIEQAYGIGYLRNSASTANGNLAPLF